MKDDPSRRGAKDRSRVAGDQEHEVRYFAKEHGISVDEAQKLIERVGNARDKLDQAARELKARPPR
ncbi:DUF3606 domain-containing protein [Rhodoligotrophos ferricapiens]|uniref:DUF3606 domain-containing protein n=1 Tax=Rhodoligotrophos ferricapiens TaxID=3069264 RepID=UPI00315D10CB